MQNIVLLLLRGVVMKKNSIIILIIAAIIIGTFFFLINKSNNGTGQLIELNYKEIKEKVKNKDDFILVITQSTCSHCATYKPKLTKIAKDYNLNIYFITIDLEKETDKKEFLKEFNFQGATPTTIFIKKGTEESVLNRLVGDINEKKIIEKFKKMGFIEE